MNTLTTFDRDTASIVLIIMLLVAASAFFLLRQRNGRSSATKPDTPDRFNMLATKAGGRVIAERLIAGALRNGASTRDEAIDRSIEQLDNDRRTWR